MKLRWIVARWTVALYFFCSSFLCSQAQTSCHQAAQTLLKSTVAQNNFVVWRGLGDYEQMLGPSFQTKLNNLSAEDTWIDMGAGEAKAIREFYLSKSADGDIPNLKVVSYKMNENAVPETKKIQVFEGRYVEDIPNNEIGKADLITDVYGPMSYSARPELVLQKYLDQLNDGGEFFWMMGSHEYLDWGVRSDIRAYIAHSDGKREELAQWLKKHIQGFEIREESYTYIQPALRDGVQSKEVQTQVLIFKKTGSSKTTIPNLELISSDSSHLPPSREFKELLSSSPSN